MKINWRKSPFTALKNISFGSTFIVADALYILVDPYEHQSDLDLRYAVNLRSGIETTFDKDLGVRVVQATVTID